MKKFSAFMLIASGTMCLVSSWYWSMPEAFHLLRILSVFIGLLSLVSAIGLLRR